MAAQNIPKTKYNPLYFHVYREVTQEAIFIDDQDFQVFTNYLNDYFSDTTNFENAKKTFTIRGRTFQGTPRLTQNFFKHIELLAYKIESNRFDLLIKQTVPGTLEKFIRALSTRYAIYFNKKHHRTGTLFKDPYKSQQIKDLSTLLHLTREFHSNFSNKVGAPTYSSYPEYLGQRETAWIKSQEILSIEGVSDYKSFVEGDKSKKSTIKHTSPSKPRIPEIILATIILILFSSYSVGNIQTPKAQSNNLIRSIPTSSPQVSGVGTSKSLDITPSPTSPPTLQMLEDFITKPVHSTSSAEVSSPSADIKVPAVQDTKPVSETSVAITISDGSESVNLRLEPTTKSEIVGKAKEGDTFIFVSENQGWHEIKLNDNSQAFVSARYSEIRKEDDSQ